MASTRKQHTKTGSLSDRNLAAVALTKRRAGEKPTGNELAALKRVEKAHEEEKRWEYYATIPQKHWREMSGKQTRQLKAQAELHGIPFGGATISLPDVVKSLHEFLAKHRFAIADGQDGDGETSTAAKRRYAVARADREEMVRDREKGKLVTAEWARERRSEVLRWAVNVMERAPSELYSLLAGKPKAQIRKIVHGYFKRIRNETFG